jgi:hypothetical protein
MRSARTRDRPTWPWWVLAAAIAAWLLWMTLRPNPSVAVDLAPLTTPAADRGISPHALISLAGNVVFALSGFSSHRKLNEGD